MMSQNKVCACKDLHTLECVIEQFQNNECTLRWAADEVGMDVEDFKEELIKRDISPFVLTKEEYERSLKLIDRLT